MQPLLQQRGEYGCSHCSKKVRIEVQPRSQLKVQQWWNHIGENRGAATGSVVVILEHEYEFRTNLGDSNKDMFLYSGTMLK